MSYNCIILLGPTAVGKTAIGVRLAAFTGGEIISADSRQVYKHLDIGSGKDLADYDIDTEELKNLFPDVFSECDSLVYHVPYHLIDITELPAEYNVYNYQQDFYRAFAELRSRNVLPVVVGGTGMYTDSVIRSYDLIETPDNPAQRKELERLSYEELKQILISEKKNLHNTTDFADKDRIIHAIEIERYLKSDECAEARKLMAPRPEIRPLVIGTTLDRKLLRQRIAQRLKARLEEGMIEEVSDLHSSGIEWERLERLGLEYRFVAQYLQGKIETKERLFELLNLAIGQFAKRQETWFRGMERKGVSINWLPKNPDIDTRLSAAVSLVRKSEFE